jgi:hypothetical protein
VPATLEILATAFDVSAFRRGSSLSKRHKPVPKWCPNHRNEARYDPPEVRAGRLVRYESGSDLVTAPEVLEDWDRFNQASLSPLRGSCGLLPQFPLALQMAPVVSGEHTHGPGFAVGDRNVSIEVATSRSDCLRRLRPTVWQELEAARTLRDSRKSGGTGGSRLSMSSLAVANRCMGGRPAIEGDRGASGRWLTSRRGLASLRRIHWKGFRWVFVVAQPVESRGGRSEVPVESR